MAVLWIIISLVILFLLFALGISIFAMIAPGATDKRSLSKIDPEGKNGYWQWYQALDWQEVGIHSFDGLRLRGRYLDNGARKTAIILHGYRATGLLMLRFARCYYQPKGYNILLPDQRAHGKSEGRKISYGYQEKHDLANWVCWVLERDPEQKIVLHGESMGAATVLQYLGAYAVNQAVPGQVVAAVSDCSFTDAREALRLANRAWYHLPEVPFFQLACWIDGLLNGYRFEEASPLKLAGEIKTPVLFVHGTEDRALPFEMSVELYEAKPEPKKLWLVHGAGHALSFTENLKQYQETLDAFLTPCLEEEHAVKMAE